MGSVALDNSTHAHSGGALEQSSCDDGISPGDGIAATSDGQDPVMHTLDDLADSGLDASLIAQVGNIFTAFSNDDSSLLGRDDGAESELGLGVFLVCLRGGLAVGSKSII